jgi:hypothetical protein
MRVKEGIEIERLASFHPVYGFALYMHTYSTPPGQNL